MILAVCVSIVLPVAAEKTKISGLYQYTLDNGLRLFVAENHMAPLVHITIAVRAGGVAQTPESTGIFHLYEHMMFEGNAKFPDVISTNAAMRKMGSIGDNATTSIDLVHYYCTIPSALVRDGLEYYSYALRTPLLKEDSLAAQKKVVISEIEGQFADPASIFTYNLQHTLFPKYPWKLDAGGTAELVQKATVQDLRDMLATYYVPNNTALFVGGDVDPDQVFALTKEIYGDWQRAPDPYETPVPAQEKHPFSKIEYRVMPTEKVSPDMAYISIFYRGPDGDTAIDDIYAADLFEALVANPQGAFVQTFLSEKDLQIPNADYIGASGQHMRATSIFSLSAGVFNPSENLPQRVTKITNLFRDSVVPEILSTSQYFTEQEFALMRQSLKDYSLMQTETASGLLSQVEHFWAISNKPELYYTYLDKLKKVKKSNIDAFIKKYIQNDYPLVTVQVNPAVYEKQKQAFKDAGFIEFTKESAYWWSK